MTPRWRTRLGLLLVAGLLTAIAACAPAAATSAPASTAAPAAESPSSEVTAAPSAPVVPAPTALPHIEGRVVELEWPEHLRLGESDVIRLALLPVEDGYVAQAEFPDHTLQSKPVEIPRPDGYTLYALARLDGVGFTILPEGDQERYVPAGEEVAWRWSLAAQKPGQQRLSVQLRLRWVPQQSGEIRESQAYARGLDVRVTSFLGLSGAQASTLGLVGLLISGGFLLAAYVPRKARPVAALQVVASNPAVRIETPPGLRLEAEETRLLQAMFARYHRLIIENEFLSGYSGARTFLVHPIRADGCADAQTIVKLGRQAAIQQEYENYETFVKDRLPPITARIQRPPLRVKPAPGVTPANQRAAMQYTFIAEPGHAPVSLRQALLHHADPAQLLRLFETFAPNWWMQRRPATFRYSQEYDGLLPPHYVLEPFENAPARGGITGIEETTSAASLRLSTGSVCRVRPFTRRELRADAQSLSLAGIPAPGQPPLRLRWLSVQPPRDTPARVVATRIDLMRGWCANFDRFGLPDPLERLPALLDERVNATVSVIHGDLNLENVLVGPGNLIWLIDFAQTREGHPLYDFAHLESELIAHVLAPQAATPRDYLERWRSGQDPLLNALHAIAGRLLFDPAQPREYHLALALACLGALKYANLSAAARHCLYLTAADLIQSL